MKKIIAVSIFTISIFLLITVIYINSSYRSFTRSFAPHTLLTSSWEKYKDRFITDEGRVVDDSQDHITTSEGQSYAMLRAVWSDDRKTFDNVWKFTKENLKRKDDELFGWRWGKTGDNKYGFLPDGGENAAGDADSDIAFALILADRRWDNWKYKEEARKILEDMWEIETGVAKGKRYVIAGNWADRGDELIINPSYFAPYAWRMFAKVDEKHDWMSLVEPAYELLGNSGKDGVGLPPDWIAIHKTTGELKTPPVEHLKTNYSFDAVRVPWRIALDYRLNKSAQAKEYLEESLGFLEREYKKNGKLYNSYNHDGKALTSIENPVMYSTALGYFMNVHPPLAKKMYEEKIIGLYSNAENTFDHRLPYYEQNWLWFGAALYNNRLITY